MIEGDNGKSGVLNGILCLPDEHDGFSDKWGLGEALMRPYVRHC